MIHVRKNLNVLTILGVLFSAMDNIGYMDVSENYWSGSPLDRIKRVKCRPIKTLPVLSTASTSATLVYLDYLDMIQSNNVLSGNISLPLGLYVANNILVV